MADVIFLAITMAFFALCVAYVRGLDHLVRASEAGGPDDATGAAES